MAEKFQTLTFPSDIHTGSGMFFGSAEDSSEMLKEAVDNALDEVTKKRVSKIRVFINEKDKSYIVSDNSIQGFSMDLASLGQTIPDVAMFNMNYCLQTSLWLD